MLLSSYRARRAAAAAAAAPAPSADAEQSRAAAPAVAATPTEDAKGVILFSNSRSGGGKGKQVLDAFHDIIGKDRVFDLGANPHPEQILAQPQIIEEARTGLRVIVCGGDGTMTWLMAAIDGVKNEVEGAKALPLPHRADAAGHGQRPGAVAELGRPLLAQVHF